MPAVFPGALNLDNCPLERYIPIWMITEGSVTLFVLLMLWLIQILYLFGKWRLDSAAVAILATIANLAALFLFAWFIAGKALL